MTWLLKALKNKEEVTPKTGFNLVKFDDYEDFGEQLMVVGEYDSEEEANAAKGAHAKAEKGVVLYVYGPQGRADDEGEQPAEE